MAKLDIDFLQSELYRLGIVKFSKSEGMSTGEWADEWGMDRKRAREMIAKFSLAGWVTLGRRSHKSIDGKKMMVPVYKIEIPASPKPSQGGRKAKT